MFQGQSNNFRDPNPMKHIKLQHVSGPEHHFQGTKSYETQNYNMFQGQSTNFRDPNPMKHIKLQPVSRPEHHLQGPKSYEPHKITTCFRARAPPSGTQIL
jgi:hypothetical protein